MSNQTQLSSKVTAQRLDIMYTNFVKMTEWIAKGKQSQYPMPENYRAVFDVVELAQTQAVQINEQNTVIGQLQRRLAEQDGRIGALETTLQAINETLAYLVDRVNQPAPEPVNQSASEPVNQPAPEPVSESEDEEPELLDLDSLTQEQGGESVGEPEPEAEAVSPNEQTVQVSAAEVNAGNLDPASYGALNNEILSMLDKPLKPIDAEIDNLMLPIDE